MMKESEHDEFANKLQDLRCSTPAQMAEFVEGVVEFAARLVRERDEQRQQAVVARAEVRRLMSEQEMLGLILVKQETESLPDAARRAVADVDHWQREAKGLKETWDLEQKILGEVLGTKPHERPAAAARRLVAEVAERAREWPETPARPIEDRDLKPETHAADHQTWQPCRCCGSLPPGAVRADWLPDTHCDACGSRGLVGFGASDDPTEAIGEGGVVRGGQGEPVSEPPLPIEQHLAFARPAPLLRCDFSCPHGAWCVLHRDHHGAPHRIDACGCGIEPRHHGEGAHGRVVVEPVPEQQDVAVDLVEDLAGWRVRR